MFEIFTHYRITLFIATMSKHINFMIHFVYVSMRINTRNNNYSNNLQLLAFLLPAALFANQLLMEDKKEITLVPYGATSHRIILFQTVR
ncbi:MAG: hypothetical protein CVV25_08570 [Ignavibacteriae bacterium HGW-Ignavibacteriae-4]|nr:MAG: hypothetical protein CVV25_08570 [Ignavibacteriae bacterium HGW-Ignavibacteriae-4]